jgi:hypothetical protein
MQDPVEHWVTLSPRIFLVVAPDGRTVLETMARGLNNTYHYSVLPKVTAEIGCKLFGDIFVPMQAMSRVCSD